MLLLAYVVIPWGRPGNSQLSSMHQFRDPAFFHIGTHYLVIQIMKCLCTETERAWSETCRRFNSSSLKNGRRIPSTYIPLARTYSHSYTHLQGQLGTTICHVSRKTEKDMDFSKEKAICVTSIQASSL